MQAVKAVSDFNGTDLAGRKILVREDREDRDVKAYDANVKSLRMGEGDVRSLRMGDDDGCRTGRARCRTCVETRSRGGQMRARACRWGEEEEGEEESRIAKHER